MTDWRSVISPEATSQLEANWQENLALKGTGKEKDYKPVCKLFLPWTSGTWLATEKEPGTSLCFGLCDLGMGSPELGYFCVEELYDVTGPAGLRVEQDQFWKAEKPLSAYADEAIKAGWLTA